MRRGQANSLNAQDIVGEPAAVLKLPRRVPGRFPRQLCRRLDFSPQLAASARLNLFASFASIIVSVPAGIRIAYFSQVDSNRAILSACFCSE